jgi:hypothetical protein
VGRVNLFACGPLDLPNFQHVLGAFVEQLDQLLVNPVNGLAVFG